MSASTACQGSKLVERAGLGGTFRKAASSLRAELAALPPEDCIDVTLVLEADGAHAKLVAIARDGRQAERDVDDPASLRAIALGLIAAAAPEPPNPLSNEDPLRESAADRPPPPPPPEPPPPLPPKTTRLVLGLDTGARFGAPTRIVIGEVEARLHVAVSDWLVGLSARYAPVGVRAGGAHIPGYSYDEIAIGFELGRRFRWGLTALDVVVSPLVVITNEMGTVPDDDIGGTDYDLRLAASARWLLPFSGVFRPSITIDAELAPFSISEPTRPDPALPPLPTWTFGLRAGASGDLL